MVRWPLIASANASVLVLVLINGHVFSCRAHRSLIELLLAKLCPARHTVQMDCIGLGLIGAKVPSMDGQRHSDHLPEPVSFNIGQVIEPIEQFVARLGGSKEEHFCTEDGASYGTADHRWHHSIVPQSN